MPGPDRPSKPRRHILLAEDDDEMRILVRDTLRRSGHLVTEAWDGADLIAKLVRAFAQGAQPPDLIISDVRMPWANGLSVLRRIRDNAIDVPVILMTAFGDSATCAEAAQLGAARLLDKPFDLADLVAAVAEVLR